MYTGIFAYIFCIYAVERNVCAFVVHREDMIGNYTTPLHMHCIKGSYFSCISVYCFSRGQMHYRASVSVTRWLYSAHVKLYSLVSTASHRNPPNHQFPATNVQCSLLFACKRLYTNGGGRVRCSFERGRTRNKSQDVVRNRTQQTKPKDAQKNGKPEGGLAGWPRLSCGRLGGLSLPGRKYSGFIGFIWHDRNFLRCCRRAGKKAVCPPLHKVPLWSWPYL